MKIFLIDNSSLTLLEDDYSIEPKTGMFAKELNDLGNEVTVFGQIFKKKHTTHTYRLIENKIKIAGVIRRKNKLLNYILLYLRAIPEIIKADYIYIFYPTNYRYVVIFCWLFRKKYGLYVRGEQGLYNRLSTLIYRYADSIFTVSDHFTSRIENISKNKNTYTIRPMIPYSDKDVIRDRNYHMENGLMRILFLGRIINEKGIWELIKAIKALEERGYNFELIIVGSGVHMEETLALVESLNLKNRIYFKGVINDVELIKEFYLEADVYILPTYHEGFPTTLYEAMIFGTPIITTMVGGIPSVMKEGYNCKSIKSKSVDSIVDSLIFAFNEYDEMRAYAKNAMSTVEEIVDSNKLSHAEHLNQRITKN